MVAQKYKFVHLVHNIAHPFYVHLFIVHLFIAHLFTAHLFIVLQFIMYLDIMEHLTMLQDIKGQDTMVLLIMDQYIIAQDIIIIKWWLNLFIIFKVIRRNNVFE